DNSDVDGYRIFASDTGSGILRHLFVVYVGGLIPPESKMRLWIDDSPVIDDFVSNFFLAPHGLIHSPFDTASSGAEVFECQIPYRHSFRWTQQGDWCWHEAEYQRIDSAALPDLTAFEADQASADTNYWKRFPWNATKSIVFAPTLHPGATQVLADIAGPAFIHQIHFHFKTLDTAILCHLWFSIHWDNCPTPSVSVPLSDLFGITLGAQNIQSYGIIVDSGAGTMDLTFPMPFKVHGQIFLTNETSSDVAFTGFVFFRDTILNPDWGYFATQYHYKPEIAYHILHPVLHVKGSGRYIGVIFNYSDSRFYDPVFMEGDGYLNVDSLSYDRGTYSVHYSGTEDYCDGGWYFDTSNVTPPVPWPAFTLPFRGSPHWPVSMYRFHINAPFNYARSMDVDWGHGFNDDYTTTYRSVAFYYTKWTPFYPSSDTIIADNVWTITGYGYPPGSPINIALDRTTIFTGVATTDGSFSVRLTVSNAWPVGNHLLSINGVDKPEWITILSNPVLLYLADSINPIYGEGDSISIRAYGFHSNESLSLFLGDTPFYFSPHVIADSDGVVRIKSFLPWVPEGIYRLMLARSDGSKVLSDSVLFIDRTLDYEFELLSSTGPTYGPPSYNYYSDTVWRVSQGAFAFCYGNWTPGSTFTFQFTVPFADTFAPTLFALKGDRYAIYTISIDGTEEGTHDWFLSQGDPLRDSEGLAPIYLTAGVHTITCFNSGHDDSTREYSFGPDNVTLRPLSPNSRPDAVPVAAPQVPISIFPNPLNESMLFLQGLSDSLREVSVRIYNEMGEEVIGTVIPISSGGGWINASDLANGSYWVVLELPTGTKAMRLNVIK
ncbi:MAG TPA: DUF2961 domain-containing protein, partial [Candidatus Kapabacteria bacterium]